MSFGSLSTRALDWDQPPWEVGGGGGRVRGEADGINPPTPLRDFFHPIPH